MANTEAFVLFDGTDMLVHLKLAQLQSLPVTYSTASDGVTVRVQDEAEVDLTYSPGWPVNMTFDSGSTTGDWTGVISNLLTATDADHGFVKIIFTGAGGEVAMWKPRWALQKR